MWLISLLNVEIQPNATLSHSAQYTKNFPRPWNHSKKWLKNCVATQLPPKTSSQKTFMKEVKQCCVHGTSTRVAKYKPLKFCRISWRG